MLKVLHVLATALETWLGIWVFSRVFDARNVMKKRHLFSEIILYTVLIFCTYSFPAFYYNVGKWRWYLPTLIIIALVILLCFLLYKVVGNQLGQREFCVIRKVLFISMVIWTSYQYWTCYQSSPFTLLGNIMPVLFLFSFFECTFSQAYLWSLGYYTNLALLKMIYVTYTGTFQNRNYEDFFLSPRMHTYSEVIYLLIICFVIWIFIKHMQIEHVLRNVLSDRKKIIFFITITEWMILRGLMGDGLGKIDRENLTITLILVFGTVVALILTLVNVMSKVANNEKTFLDARNRALELQYQELNAAYEKYRCLVHDEKHMMFYLRECLDNGEVQTAINFLDSYQNRIVNNGSSFHTGISVLDFILNIKKRKMNELKVRLTLDVEVEKTFMDDTDFVMLIGNLLDNAIEAVEKCYVEERWIHLTLQSINEMLFLKMKNSSTEFPIVENMRFFTGKKEKEEHGWGIESVKRIVEKNNGQISFKYDSSFFEVSIIINE